MIYVDDMMSIMEKLKWGSRFIEGKLVVDEEARKEDAGSKRCQIELTRTVCLEMLNSISSNIQFTAEVITDYAEGWLPTLDFKLRVGENGCLQHSFFEKGMNPNWVVPRMLL